MTVPPHDETDRYRHGDSQKQALVPAAARRHEPAKHDRQAHGHDHGHPPGRGHGHGHDGLFAFVATAVSGLVVLLTGFVRADAVATLAVAALMLKAGYGLVRDSGRI